GHALEVHLPLRPQRRQRDRLVPDRLVVALLGDDDVPANSHAERPLHAPARQVRARRLDGHHVAEKTWQVLEVPIEPEDVGDRPSNRHARLDRFHPFPRSGSFAARSPPYESQPNVATANAGATDEDYCGDSITMLCMIVRSGDCWAP